MKRPLLALALLSLTALAQAQSGYVQSRQAKLQKEPNFSAEVLATLPRGTQVEILTTQGRWYQVQHAEQQAWVSRFLISDTPPLDKVSVLDEQAQAESLVTNARQRASAVTSAGAARGLTADERQRASSAGLSNYFSVDMMENARVTPDEALEFLAAGGAQ